VLKNQLPGGVQDQIRGVKRPATHTCT
jgi:hypothetical protein